VGRRSADPWSDLVAEAGEDAIERAAGVSVAQAERELAQAGFDVASERAKAEATLASLSGEATRSGPAPAALEGDAAEPAAWVTKTEPAPVRPRSTRWTLLLAAALAAAATGGVLYALGHRTKPIEGPREPPAIPAPSALPSPAPAPPLPREPEGRPKPPTNVP
jgi:hypothetical protein